MALVSVEAFPGLPTLRGKLVSSYVVQVKSRNFSFILIFLLAPEGLFSNRNIGQVCTYFLFYSFVTLLLHRLAVRISLPFYDFLFLYITEMYNREDLGISVLEGY